MKYTLLLFLLVSINYKIFSQSSAAKDSLIGLIPKAKQDTNLINLYGKLGDILLSNNMDSAKIFYLKARELNRKLNISKGEIDYINNYSQILNLKGNIDSSILINKKAIEIALKMSEKTYLAKAYSNLGTAYFYKGNYDLTINNYLLSQGIWEKLGSKKYQGKLFHNIACVNLNLEQPDKGLINAIKAEKMAREVNDLKDLSFALATKSICLTRLNRYKEAETGLLESIEISKKINNKNNYANCLLNLGSVFMKSKQYEKIKPYAEEALKITNEMGDVEGYNTSLRAMVVHYFYTKNFDKANEYGKKLFDHSLSLDNKEYQMKAAKWISDIYLAKNDLNNYDKYNNIADSLETIIDKDDLTEKIEEINTKYETEKKETQIKLQTAEIKQKTTNNYLLIGGLSTLAIISLLGYRNYRSRQKLDKQRISELETQQQLTATEAILMGENQERSRLAKDLHDGLGGMLSGIKHSFASIKGNMVMSADNTQTFERSLDMVDNSIKEMRRVAHNMMPEALVKFGLNAALNDYCGDINDSGALKIDYKGIGIELNQIDQTKAISIYRIIQELTNNIIKHAEAKTAIVQVINTDNNLNITVEDDGKGFDKSKLDAAKGMGWGNIYNRVEFLKGKIQVDSEIGKGTSVFIEV
jgi:two-component system, NarL family, sensor kinase